MQQEEEEEKQQKEKKEKGVGGRRRRKKKMSDMPPLAYNWFLYHNPENWQHDEDRKVPGRYILQPMPYIFILRSEYSPAVSRKVAQRYAHMHHLDFSKCTVKDRIYEDVRFIPTSPSCCR